MSKDIFRNRYQVIRIIIVSFALIFLTRLFYLQVISSKYVALANNNAIKELDVYPTRGMIYDRKGELIVFNEAIYDLMVTPYETKKAKGFDTLKMCELLGITKEDILDRFEKMKKQKGYVRIPNVFAKQLSLKDYSRLQEYMYLFPGFYGQVRTIRKYPHRVAATILGDIGEVDDKQIEKSKGYYKPGDYVGKSGIEKVYEKELGGKRVFDRQDCDVNYESNWEAWSAGVLKAFPVATAPASPASSKPTCWPAATAPSGRSTCASAPTAPSTSATSTTPSSSTARWISATPAATTPTAASGA